MYIYLSVELFLCLLSWVLNKTNLLITQTALCGGNGEGSFTRECATTFPVWHRVVKNLVRGLVTFCSFNSE